MSSVLGYRARRVGDVPGRWHTPFQPDPSRQKDRCAKGVEKQQDGDGDDGQKERGPVSLLTAKPKTEKEGREFGKEPHRDLLGNVG